jgi:hypothetical protein
VTFQQLSPFNGPAHNVMCSPGKPCGSLCAEKCPSHEPSPGLFQACLRNSDDAQDDA